MIISRQAIAAFCDRQLDSFTWMKSLSRRELQLALRQFHPTPAFKTDPWLHQLVCVYIGLCHPRFLFLLDMGLGKTKILSDLVTYAKRDGSLKHALILVPNLVNMDSWRDDLRLHSDLEPWLCDVENIGEKWRRLSNPQGDVTLIDYAGLHLALCKKTPKGKKSVYTLDEGRIRAVQSLYNFIGIDESHKLKNHQNLWFSLVCRLTATADRVYATTGTIFGKNPEEMWSQFKLVDGGETFGENLGLFRGAFFGVSQDAFKGTVYTFNKRRTDGMNLMMQHRSIRYDEKEVPEVDLPLRTVIAHKLKMSEEQREHYLRALDSLMNAEGTGDAQAIEAPWLRMRQIVSGYLAWKDEHGSHVVPFKENPKLEALEKMCTEVGESKIVVCYDYTETGRIIVERIKKLNIGYAWLYGDTKDKVGTRSRFINDPQCRVLVMNSEAGGTGNNGLQRVARYMVFYESPTSPITRKQTEKRLHRPGQKERVFIYDLVMKRSPDQGILDSIAEGRDLFESIVNKRLISRALLGGC